VIPSSSSSSSSSLSPSSLIGDNPIADIRVANNAGDHWHSVLVRTGVFKGSNDDNDASDKADVVVDDIYDAINTIIKDNNNK